MSHHWMPFYWSDYFADTAHLTTLEHGAYFLLIGHYWNRGPIPDDPKVLRRITKMDRFQWRRVWPTLQPFFYLSTFSHTNSLHEQPHNEKQLLSKCWRHKRIDAEREKAEIISTKRSLSGQKGGRGNLGKTNIQRTLAKANAKQRDRQPQPHRDSSTSSESETDEKPTLNGARTVIEPSSALLETIAAKGWANEA